MARMISPNELHAAACKAYGFVSPTTKDEWALCVNFWAANIGRGLEVEACKLLAKIFNCPLSQAAVEHIARFQKEKKDEEEAGG
jgi:hypothetical protein